MNDVGHVYIPAHIMAREDLSLKEKALVGKIIGLTKNDGYCTATNNWLAEQMGVTQDWVSHAITKFVRLSIFQRTLQHGNSGEITKRKLTPWYGLQTLHEGGIGEIGGGIGPQPYRGIGPQPVGIQDKISKNKEINNKNYLQRKDVFSFTQGEIQELKEKFPHHNIPEEIESMRDWVASSGKRYKDYLAFARNWLRRAKPSEVQRVTVRA